MPEQSPLRGAPGLHHPRAELLEETRATFLAQLLPKIDADELARKRGQKPAFVVPTTTLETLDYGAHNNNPRGHQSFGGGGASQVLQRSLKAALYTHPIKPQCKIHI